ncbi:MAG: glycosyltransferase [Actinomycetota bacterium]|nr:glycosyltransferase [Actinomycetota bacterium]
MTVLAGLAVAGLAAWLYLLVGHGLFWRTDQRLPFASDPPVWPEVVAIVPARNEASVLPLTLPTLLGQDYPGRFRVVVVDDESDDGTAAAAEAAATAAATRDALTMIKGTALPPGWVGKVWAMSQGAAEAGEPGYLLFTDADIVHEPSVVAALVRAAEARGLDLVSQMARLHTTTFWERAILPAFVYFFAMLYPFRQVNRPAARTAGAAGGCMLVRREALEAAGGLEGIRGRLIDDVSLGRLLKRRPGSGGMWLGHAAGVTSIRPHRFGDLWAMVARSAYTQLRYSPALLAGTVAGLVVLFAVPPVAAITGLVDLAGGGSGAASVVAASCGLAAWVTLAATEVPILRLYGLGPLRGLALPMVAFLYTAMTVDSARRHRRGVGGTWKGRPAARAR